MIVDHRPVAKVSATPAKGEWPARAFSGSSFWVIAFCVAAFCVTVLLQTLSGAYQSEFSGYPDESAHYVTGLMVRDYIAGMHWGSPLEFAQDYYSRYPKVAFGHWPPLFYILEALWMLIFPASRAAVLLGLAVLTTVLAWMVFRETRRRFRDGAGALAGLLFVCLPVTQEFSTEVMAESLLAITCFAAALFFSRYLERERWQDSLWFGVFASLAILTKGNGWSLALVPPAALLLTRRIALIRKWSFWLPAGVVCVLCAPWQVVTMSLVQRGWQGGDHPSLAYTLSALGRFFPVFTNLLGWGLLPLVLLGLLVAVALPYRRRAVEPFWATLFALIFAEWIFHSLVPAGVEPRKLIAAVPAMILFLMAGGAWIQQRTGWRPLVLAAACAAIFAVQQFSIPKKLNNGYRAAAAFIGAQPSLKDALILVCSEHDGEGMLVSELAMRRQGRGWHILRGTKVLALTNWNGEVFQDYFQTPEALLAYLRDTKVSVLVTDTLPSNLSFAFQRNLREMLAVEPAHFEKLGTFSGQTPGAVEVFRVL